MSSAPMIRLHLFFAHDNSSALILRRSGQRLYNLISWDREADTFSEGQWLRKSVRAEDCALSPDGRHFIYAVHDAHPDTPATSHYTVASRAPWFTALALFPYAHPWQRGGGFFHDNGLYQLHTAGAGSDIIGRADGLHQVVMGEVTKDCRTGLRLSNGQAAPLSKPLRARLLSGAAAPSSDAFDRYETQAGRLYHRRGMDLTLIRDFTDMTPVFEPAPYSVPRKDNDANGWYPLDLEESP